jgi:hypothetical protein
MLKLRTLSLIALGALCIASWTIGASASPLGDCRATKATKTKGVNHNGDPVVRWALTCSGKCKVEDDGTTPTCAEQTGSDAGGNYTFCGCNGAVGTECCQLISRWNKDGSEKPDFIGDCPACPASGTCQVVMAADGGSAQASCLPPTPPPGEGH